MTNDKNYVSVWFWMFAIVVAALPCLGTVFALIFAFVGENESRKNYFRAVLLLQLLIIALVVVIHALGLGAVVYKAIQDGKLSSQ